MSRFRLQAAPLLGAILCTLAACSTGPSDSPARSDPTATLSARTSPVPADVVLSDEPTSIFGIEGRSIVTPSYRIFLTERDPVVARRIPVFLESALAHYRSVLAPLPAPEQQMQTYILADRSQWVALTRRLVPEQAETYLKIRAGGFANRGRALLFNIGSRATFATCAHEGWHQYTQRVFRQGLPIWLEEGIATLMEGYRWAEDDPRRPEFRTWANIDRFDRLRELVLADRAFTLTQLLTQRPQDLLNTVDNERALDYYAQVWALAHFLAEGDGGRYRPGLEAMLSDAQRGRFYGRVRREAGPRAFAQLVRRRVGDAPFRLYITDDIDAANASYARFLRRITAVGTRGAIAEGVSPLTTR